MRRIGTAPKDRKGCVSESNCPDILLEECSCPDVLHEGDRVIVIGTLLPGLPTGAPPDAGIGPDEAAVAIPYSVFTDACVDDTIHRYQAWKTREVEV